MGHPAISAILPLKNKKAFLAPCLDSVIAAAGSHGGVEIVVADNGSSDGSLEDLERWGAGIRVLRVPGTTIAGARNAGARAATAAILAFIDCDCVVPIDYFNEVARLLGNGSISATGYEVRLPSPGSWIERTWDGLQSRSDDGPRHYLNSASFAVAAAAFHEVGGFDERLVTGEDTDICLRLTAFGHRIWGARALQVTHLDNPKTLGEFFRKERWRGLGGLSAAILARRRRSAVAVMAFGGTLAVAGFVLANPGPLPLRLTIAAALVLVVPVLTTAYRMVQVRRFAAPLRAVALYLVYYLARLAALFEVLGRRIGKAAGPVRK